MDRRVLISKADRIGHDPIYDLVIEASECISHRAPGAPQHVVAAAMEEDAKALVAALHNTLPQGTWARFVALMARQWADDQQGIISATAWYPGLSKKVDQVGVASELQKAYDEMMPGEPGRDNVVAALRLLGIDPESEE